MECWFEWVDYTAEHIFYIAEKQGVTPEDFKKNREADIPLKRIGKPEDVAKAVVFIASEESSYTIGEAFNVSGGLVMH